MHNGVMITKLKCVDILCNKKGFTLIHLLIGLSVSLVILTSFSVFLSYLLKTSNYSKDLHPYEWNVFLLQLNKDFKNAKQIKVNSNVISYKDLNERNVTISQYGKIIRYQVEGEGHIVLLQHVEKVQFQKVKNGVFLQVESLGRKMYDATIRDYKGLIKE